MKNIVVIGNGMVGQRFCEKLVEYDTAKQYRLTAFCEEPRVAYDRVGLTSFFAHRDAEKLMLAKMAWYKANNVELHLGDRACEIDRKARVVRSDNGVEIAYDHVIMATGSYPFVPPVPGCVRECAEAQSKDFGLVATENGYNLFPIFRTTAAPPLSTARFRLRCSTLPAGANGMRVSRCARTKRHWSCHAASSAMLQVRLRPVYKLVPTRRSRFALSTRQPWLKTLRAMHFCPAFHHRASPFPPRITRRKMSFLAICCPQIFTRLGQVISICR